MVPAAGETYLTAGEYYVDVHGANVPQGTGTFRLFVWTVGADRGNAAVDGPSSVNAGQDETLTVTWQGLDPGRHLGHVSHTDGANVLGQTVIEITAP